MISSAVKEELRKIVGKDNFFDEIEERICYSYDGTTFKSKPDLVLKPANVQEVSHVLKAANREKIPVVPRGAGTGLSGGSVPVEGGIVLAMNRLNRILSIDEENLVAFVEPGVITEEFQKEVEKRELFYPPDPASQKMCTLGGNIAECAGGPHCLKYGVTRDYVLGLEVVLADGSIIKTGGQVMKNVSGYDLTRLFIGSEGTLGVVTKIVLKLLPLPEYRRTILAAFSTMEGAAETVSAIIAGKLIPATLEFMDGITIKVVEEFLNIGLPTTADALLLIEVDGKKEAVEIDYEKVMKICKDKGAVELKGATTAEERENLWKARRAVSAALGRICPLKLNEDVVVPRSKLPSLITKVKEICTEFGIKAANYGHAGDGNLHVNVLVESRADDEMKKVEPALEKLYEEVVNLGGTISGEHGIGFLKSKYLYLDAGIESINAMKKIKDVLDPNNILNPGKIFVRVKL